MSYWPETQSFNETFVIGMNSLTSTTAAAACYELGAWLATAEQLTRDWQLGAEWCAWGFTGQHPNMIRVLQPHTLGPSWHTPCSAAISLSQVVHMTLPKSTPVDLTATAGAVCWGKKPRRGEVPANTTILPFNPDRWSLFDSTGGLVDNKAEVGLSSLRNKTHCSQCPDVTCEDRTVQPQLKCQLV